jgi:outer membrane murein-binding lipoprotein Lpp
MNRRKRKMKRQSLTILVVLLATVALAGCGVPQEDYDQVVNDLAEAQAEIADLETELTAAQNEYSALQGELDATVAEYENLQAEYDDLDAALEEGAAEYDDLVATLEKVASDIDGAHVYHSIVVELLGPAITGDALTAPETVAAVGDLVEEAGDENLQEKFDAWSASAWDRSLAYDLLWYAQVKLEELVFEMGD